MNAPHFSTGQAAMRLLIVDDHPNTAKTLARALAMLDLGIEIQTADCGEQALELINLKPVDLLITDMVMPGISGLELIEKLQSRPGNQPYYTALITAYDTPGLKENARRLKVNDILNKPIRPERIGQIISKVIEDLKHRPAVQRVDPRPGLITGMTSGRSENVTLPPPNPEIEGQEITLLPELSRELSVRLNINELMQTLFNLEKIDTGSLELSLESVNVNKLAAAVTEEFHFQVCTREKTLDFDQAKEEPESHGQGLQTAGKPATPNSPQKGLIIVSIQTDQNTANIRVQDNGVGIPEKDLAFIFTRFCHVQTEGVPDIEGSGLSLAIVKSIVEKHGGQVSMESEYGKGSCFSISLPLNQAPEQRMRMEGSAK